MGFNNFTETGAEISSVQNSSYSYAADAEASDAYAIALDPAITAYADGQQFTFKANTANTGGSTLNVNGVGAITLKKEHDKDTVTGDIESGSIVEVVYDGTNFQIISSSAAAATGDMTAAVYDPTSVAGDAFDMDNMVEGTNLILSSAERTIIGDTSNTNTGDQTNISGNAATVTTNANLTGVVTSIGNATAIADKALAIAKIADGTAGELVTWSAAGVITVVGVGTVTHVLTSNGAGVAPTFQAIAGGGDVSKVGTPVDSQVGVWTGDGTLEGAASFTYDGSNLQITGDIGATGGRITKGWFTDLEVTNAIAGSITGNAATASVATEITVIANPAEDTDAYLLFTDGSTGNHPAETDSSLTYNPMTNTLTTAAFVGALDAADGNITGVGSASFTRELDGGSETGAFSVDFATDQKQKTTLTANVITLTLDTTSVGVGNYLLKIVNGGLATLTWASETGSIFFPGGTDPVLTASGTDIVSFYHDGTNWYGAASLAFS